MEHYDLLHVKHYHTKIQPATWVKFMELMSLMTVIPSLSTPVTAWSDDHLAAVVCICAVHIQLQLFPFIRFNDGEEILTLLKEQRHRAGQPIANFQSELLLICKELYLIHQSVGSYNVVSVGSQTSQGCRRVWLHFLDSNNM